MGIDVLREKAIQTAKQEIPNPLDNPETQRQLEELKVTDPDAWYNKRKELETAYNKQINSKADEYYAMYQRDVKLQEAGLTQDELKSKMTASEWEAWQNGKDIDLSKFKDSKEDNKDTKESKPKSKSDEEVSNPPLDLTKVRSSEEAPTNLGLEDLYSQDF